MFYYRVVTCIRFTIGSVPLGFSAKKLPVEVVFGGLGRCFGVFLRSWRVLGLTFGSLDALWGHLGTKNELPHAF